MSRRSVSPNTVEAAPQQSGFRWLLLLLRREVFPQKRAHAETASELLEVDGFNDHIAEKRRRLSLHQHETLRRYIPRSSVDYGANGTNYESVVNRIVEEDDSNNNMERRNTVVEDLQVPVVLEKYDLPIPDMELVRRQSTAMVQMLQSDSESEVVLEQAIDIAPLYTDDAGNLVRPPFINLDPRERYQLVQLKREMELTRLMQRQLKYTVDPNETQSTLLPSNKVETATQTHDIHYLRNKLNFSLLVKRDAPRPKKNTAGYFSGDFAYDLEETPDTLKNSLKGYLGSVSKPAFTKSDKRGHTTEKVHLSLDKDYLSRAENVSDIIKVKEPAPETKSHVEPSTGFKFNINKNEINELINKRKQDNELALKAKRRASDDLDENKKPSLGPSKLDQKPAFSFGAPKPTSESEKPSFSFGPTKLSTEPPKPSFSFGAPKAATDTKVPAEELQGTEPSKPVFSFNPPKSEPPIANTEEKKEDDKAPKPLFSFNPPASGSTEAAKPAFTFGGSTSTDTKDKPSFSFGAPSADKPQFSFGQKKEPQDAKPSFSFGKVETPKNNEPSAFSLGGQEPKTGFSFEQKKAEGLTPSLGPAAKKEESLASGSDSKATKGFSFGQKEKTPFSFTPEADRASSEEPAAKFARVVEAPKRSTGLSFGTGPSETKPAFTFGVTSEKSEDKPKPGFAFGASDKNDDKPKPALAFGSTPAAKPAFSFGASKEGTPNSAGSASGSAENPNFSFKSADKPSFNFGAVEKPSFSFGATTKPDFNFGATATPVFGGLAPAAGGRSTSGFQFGATTPSFGKESTPAGSNGAFAFANGVTPVKPMQPVSMNGEMGAFNKEATPNQFNFSRSTTGTPEFGAPAPAAGFGGKPRKIAQMRRRRGM